MKRSALLLVMALFALPAGAVTDRPAARMNRAVAGPPSAAGIRFTVFGDFRPARSGDPYPSQFRQALDAMKAAKPFFAVSTGDAWYGYGSDMARFKAEVEQFLSIVGEWEVPLFNAFGNHEVSGSTEREAYLKARFGNLYGSFDSGGAHFIVLDTDEAGKEGLVTGDQLRWLEVDLERNQGASARFVFMHRPLFSVVDPDFVKKRSFIDRGNRDTLHRLFVRHRVTAVFAGHDHLYDERVVDGVRYFITGGGGAPLYAKEERGGYYHYLLVTVSGNQTRVEVKRIGGRQ